MLQEEEFGGHCCLA